MATDDTQTPDQIALTALEVKERAERIHEGIQKFIWWVRLGVLVLVLILGVVTTSLIVRLSGG